MGQIADLEQRVKALEEWKNDLQSKIEASEESEKNYKSSQKESWGGDPKESILKEDLGSGSEDNGPVTGPILGPTSDVPTGVAGPVKEPKAETDPVAESATVEETDVAKTPVE